MSDAKKRANLFTKRLMEWFAQNHRPLPWKGEKNPYLIWLSEIILQQTRVEQGLPYFEKFRDRYPKVEDLANAPEDEVMKMWEGLGYYSRARNLHFTAKFIANELNGQFPVTFSEILGLKGVGSYTAAAIASFAYDLPHAVVDGNVYRVLSRVFGIETAIDISQGKKEFSKLAQELLDTSQPGNYNQAIMDFGATHCLPVNPKCERCLMQEDCVGFKLEKIDQLPFKSKRVVKKNRFFNYLIFNQNENVWLRKRIEKDIWQNLYEFPMIESKNIIETQEEIITHDFWKGIIQSNSFQLIKISQPFKQVLTHQKIVARFWEIQVDTELNNEEKDFKKIDRKNLNKFAFPKVIDRYLNSKSLDLFSSLVEGK